jgi:uncharacterized protein (TIGR02145 family)
MKKNIFISYSKDDEMVALKVCSFLESQGITCWISERDVPPGREFDESIIDGIDNSDAFILILTKSANTSRYVKSEVNRAFSKGKSIFTFRVSDVFPSPQLELYLSRPQWLDGFPPPIEQKLGRLASAIQALLGLNIKDPREINFKLKELRVRLLCANNLSEIKKVQYELDNILNSDPTNVEARLLYDQILTAINNFSKIEFKDNTSPNTKKFNHQKFSPAFILGILTIFILTFFLIFYSKITIKPLGKATNDTLKITPIENISTNSTINISSHVITDSLSNKKRNLPDQQNKYFRSDNNQKNKEIDYNSRLENIEINKTIKKNEVSSLINTEMNNILIDSRDNQKYKTVKIGNQIWMAENLNYLTMEGSWCYYNLDSLCQIYGRLYDWETAMKVSPKGWHLPSDDEWKQLELFLGMDSSEIHSWGERGIKIKIGEKLRSTLGWECPNSDIVNFYNFSMLPAGARAWHLSYPDLNGRPDLFKPQNTLSFCFLGGSAIFWTSTATSKTEMINRSFSISQYGLNRSEERYNNAYSVRCIKDITINQ